MPASFRFAVKASCYITHMKKLKDPEPSFARFFERIDRLAEQLGPVLFQLPPRWGANVERLKRFLRALPTGYRYAFEFRDESWWIDEVAELLGKLCTNRMSLWLGEPFVIKACRRRRAGGHAKTTQRRARTARQAPQGAP